MLVFVSAPLRNNFALLVDYTHDMIFQIPTGNTSVTEDNFIALDIPEVESPIGAVYDAKTGYIYWSELYNKQIKRIQLGGTNVTTVLKLGKHTYTVNSECDCSNKYFNSYSLQDRENTFENIFL